MKSKEAALKETTLITIGLLGKTSHQETLGKCLLWLFEALDQRNVLLRSQAYMQVGSIYINLKTLNSHNWGITACSSSNISQQNPISARISVLAGNFDLHYISLTSLS